MQSKTTYLFIITKQCDKQSFLFIIASLLRYLEKSDHSSDYCSDHTPYQGVRAYCRPDTSGT